MSDFGPDHWQTEQSTPTLRFVRRVVSTADGDMPRMILQQRWRITEGANDSLFGGTNVCFEWRDVPVGEE